MPEQITVPSVGDKVKDARGVEGEVMGISPINVLVKHGEQTVIKRDKEGKVVLNESVQIAAMGPTWYDVNDWEPVGESDDSTD